ncbi:MAG: LCP family protein [Haloechinothrix sp.]
MRVGKAAVALVSTAALLLTGYAYMTLDNLRTDINTTDALEHSDGAPKDDGAVDILLVGTDARTDTRGNPLSTDMLKELRTEHKAGVNTDTLIILRMPRDGGHPTAVSIPRDTWVGLPSGGTGKINSAFNTAKQAELAKLRADGATDRAERERESDQAGRTALVHTISDFTDIRIDHYAEVSLLGFYLLTEALGGVDVCLNHATVDKDSGADFEPGRQVVKGGEALSFVRQRKNLPRGDLDRIVRQQVFLGSALHKVLSAGTLTSPAKLEELTDAVHRSVVLDPDLDILEFAEKAKTLASGDVEFVTIPVVTISGHSKDGQSVVEVDTEAVRAFIADLVDKAPAAKDTSAGGGSSGAGRPVVLAPSTEGGVPCVN